jgi:hypothetical protein
VLLGTCWTMLFVCSWAGYWPKKNVKKKLWNGTQRKAECMESLRLQKIKIPNLQAVLGCDACGYEGWYGCGAHCAPEESLLLARKKALGLPVPGFKFGNAPCIDDIDDIDGNCQRCKRLKVKIEIQWMSQKN